MNKSEFISAIVAETGGTKTDVAKVVDSVFSVVKKALKSGEEIRLVGFGTFKVIETSAKVVRNPQNGEKINVPAGKRPRFVPGKDLKDSVK